jgi:PPK2 family polyphosphate:nucleotide phosphotransferase
MNRNEMAADDPRAWARFRIANPGAPVSLAAFDPAEKPCSLGDKQEDRARVDQLAVELDDLQNLFYADRRYKLLMVLQGLDTSGKDGTLRTVFGRMSPLGVRTAAWKAPTEAERDHDFLWRIHKEVPGSGEVVAFNRSHYEDVLVPVVNGQLSREQTYQRYAQINDFERLITETGTIVLKFMLHISKDEQRRRLQARLDDPAKRYKFQREDLKVRKQWDLYQIAYEHAITATGTSWAPWIIVPADSKTHRNLMIALILHETLRGLGLRYPDDDPTLKSLKIR